MLDRVLTETPFPASFRRLARFGGDPADFVEVGAGRRNVDVEDFGDNSRPAVDEVRPAVLDLQLSARFLATRLVEKD